MAEHSTNLAVGSKIGPYEIQSQLGQGGMATVYKAFQSSLNRPVAIKVMADRYASDPVFVERFRREARSIASLHHPNILTVYDAGEVDGLLYMVMEYIDGETLREELQGQPIGLDRCAKVVDQVSAALHYANGKGIVHRDVKPSNVLLDKSSDRAVLADFGIAKLLDGTGANLTATNEGMGTPEYMSPEQALGETLDARSDEYSLSAMTFEMLSGRTPFQGDTPIAIVLGHVSKDLPSLHALNREVTPAVENVVRRGLSKKPADRYPSVAAFNTALQKAFTTLEGLGNTEPATITPLVDPPTLPIGFQASQPYNNNTVVNSWTPPANNQPPYNTQPTGQPYGTPPSGQPYGTPPGGQAYGNNYQYGPGPTTPQPQPYGSTQPTPPYNTGPYQNVNGYYQPVPVAAKKSSPVLLLGGIGAIVVIALILIVVILAGSGGKKDATPVAGVPTASVPTATTGSNSTAGSGTSTTPGLTTAASATTVANATTIAASTTSAPATTIATKTTAAANPTTGSTVAPSGKTTTGGLPIESSLKPITIDDATRKTLADSFNDKIAGENIYLYTTASSLDSVATYYRTPPGGWAYEKENNQDGNTAIILQKDGKGGLFVASQITQDFIDSSGTPVSLRPSLKVGEVLVILADSFNIADLAAGDNTATAGATTAATTASTKPTQAPVDDKLKYAAYTSFSGIWQAELPADWYLSYSNSDSSFSDQFTEKNSAINIHAEYDNDPSLATDGDFDKEIGYTTSDATYYTDVTTEKKQIGTYDARLVKGNFKTTDGTFPFEMLFVNRGDGLLQFSQQIYTKDGASLVPAMDHLIATLKINDSKPKYATATWNKDGKADYIKYTSPSKWSAQIPAGWGVYADFQPTLTEESWSLSGDISLNIEYETNYHSSAAVKDQLNQLAQDTIEGFKLTGAKSEAKTINGQPAVLVTAQEPDSNGQAHSYGFMVVLSPDKTFYYMMTIEVQKAEGEVYFQPLLDTVTKSFQITP